MKKKITLSVCIPDLVIGGVETVLLNTLHQLARYKDLKIQVLMISPLDLEYFKTWFAAHPDIDVFVQCPLTPVFKRMERYTNFFPIKNIRKITYSLYKKYCRARFSRTRQWHDTDIFIDYKNFAFYPYMRRTNKPKLVWMHGSINYFDSVSFLGRLGAYDKMVCLTDSFASDFCTRHPAHADRVIRVYNPIDYKRIASMATDAPHGDGKYFCSVMRLAADKDAETLIRAFNKFWIDNKRPDVRLMIIGDGGYRDTFENLAHSLPADKNIIFTGTITEPYGYMRGAIAHILSSNSEGLPTVLIEAAAVGTVNIASDCPNGPHEILMDGRAGILFTPGDVDALADALADVYYGRVDTSKMCATGAKGLARFDANAIALQIHDMIQNMVK